MADKKDKPFISYKLRGALVCYSIIIIPILLLGLFTYLPVFWAFQKSFYDFEIGGISHFVGLSHYIEYFTTDPTTYISLVNMAFFTLFAVVVRLSLPLIVAKLIISIQSERWRHFYRILFLAPIVVPGVATMLIWGGMIYSSQGLINEFLRLIGLGNYTHAWLANPGTALIAVAMVGFPFIGGFEVLIYYAGLSGIPESVNEAALLEGCVGIRKFFLIDIPMVLSQLKLILILTVIAGIQGFEGLIILTSGGPGYRTTVPGLMMYFNAFSFQRFGYACAVGVILFVLIFTLTIINFKFFKSAEELQATK
ncbi:MAG: hypothetical protein DRI44_01970 [Chlamydiae bacterium]|nr:MAG: hypothetical protein DRI44_01970 [Chlamydiota bacterium]